MPKHVVIRTLPKRQMYERTTMLRTNDSSRNAGSANRKKSSRVSSLCGQMWSTIRKQNLFNCCVSRVGTSRECGLLEGWSGDALAQSFRLECAYHPERHVRSMPRTALRNLMPPPPS